MALGNQRLSHPNVLDLDLVKYSSLININNDQGIKVQITTNVPVPFIGIINITIWTGI
jgi:hypothetical protein